MDAPPRPAPPLDPADAAQAVAQASRAWEDLRGARLLLTGCTGFFGAWLMETLLQADAMFALGLDAVVLTRAPARYRARMPHVAGHRAVTLWQGDIRSFEPPPGAFTHLVHGAVPSGGELYDAGDALLDVLVEGTRHVLDVARGSGTVRALFLSSGAVYGPQPPGVEALAETMPTGPAGAYARGKREGEVLFLEQCREGRIHGTLARCFAFLGPHLPLDLHFAAGNFIRDALAGGPVRIAGDGTAVRSYMYGSDLAGWLWTLLLRGTSGSVYNVGSGRAVTILELARAVAGIAGCEVEIQGLRDRPGKAARYVPDIGKARRELGLEGAVGLEEAIARTLAWNRLDRGLE